VTASRVARISAVLFLLLAIVIVMSVTIGPADIGIIKGLKSLLGGWFAERTNLTPAEKTILFSIRLPRVLFAALVGAALSAAGVVFQALLRNPLADPYILGISSGAAVGAIIGIVIGAAVIPFGVPFLAFAGATVTVLMVFTIGRTRRGIESNTLLLAGVIVNAFFSAVIMFLISVADNADLHNITFWLMGNLSLVTLREIAFLLVFSVGGFAVIYSYARHLNCLVIGEETALQLGINVERTKIMLFLAASLMTGVAVAFSGVIGFVGLIIPHIMRMLFGSDHRLVLPASFLFGASFLAVADTIARTAVSHNELPVGVITALCGAPYFIYLLRRRAV